MSQSRGVSTGVKSVAKRAQKDEQLLLFDADRILQGICFHLAEEFAGLELDADSLRSTRARLARAKVRAIATRSHWCDLTNRQRLQWLLAQGRSVLATSGEALVLTPQS